MGIFIYRGDTLLVPLFFDEWFQQAGTGPKRVTEK